MRSRRVAREAALQALYQCESLDHWDSPGVEEHFSAFHPTQEGENEADRNENAIFSKRLALGVIENRELLDTKIQSASAKWSVNRMTRVDRNILRMATYELIFLPKNPRNVVFNEAIEIAKRFGTDDSHAFINGILDRVAKEVPVPNSVTTDGISSRNY